MSEYSDKQLGEKLTEALESWPLYRELKYTGAPTMLRLPGQIRWHCPSCRTEQVFSGNFPPGHNHRTGFNQQVYVCRCRQTELRFCYFWVGPGSQAPEGRFLKIGQYPSVEERISPALQETLDPEDVQLYKNAVRLRNYNMGLGALAYMRRVVENRMNDILDIVHEVAVGAKPEGEESLARFTEVKNDLRFGQKVEYAAAMMPQHILPDGAPNPIGILHSLTSDGLHSLTDEECVDTFDQCKLAFEYLFTNLRPRLEDAEAYRQSLAKLSQKQLARKKALEPAKQAGKEGETPAKTLSS